VCIAAVEDVLRTLYPPTQLPHNLTADEQYRKGGMEMSSEKEILALEDKRFAAMIRGDWKAVQALAHDQLLYTHSSAVTDT
jgi:hypothetical protein